MSLKLASQLIYKKPKLVRQTIVFNVKKYFFIFIIDKPSLYRVFEQKVVLLYMDSTVIVELSTETPCIYLSETYICVHDIRHIKCCKCTNRNQWTPPIWFLDINYHPACVNYLNITQFNLQITFTSKDCFHHKDKIDYQLIDLILIPMALQL